MGEYEIWMNSTQIDGGGRIVDKSDGGNSIDSDGGGGNVDKYLYLNIFIFLKINTNQTLKEQ